MRFSRMGRSVRLEAHGCYAIVTMEKGDTTPTLWTTPILIFPEDEEEDWVEVTNPEQQGFLDAVNDWFGTEYQVSQFAGR